MNGDTLIGKVTQFVIVSTDPNGNKIETSLNKNFIENENANYTQVDTATRSIMELSRNTYSDTICVTNISVTEVLAG